MAKLNRDDVDKLYEYGIYIPTKTIISVGETDAEIAANLLKGLHILDNVNQDKSITIELNNVGGDEYHGMAVYDTIKACVSHVKIIGKGQIMSMGSIMFQAADERIMAPNAKQMIHYGTPVLADSDAHAKVQYKWTEECKNFSKWMEDMYLEKVREKHPEFSRKRLIKMLDFDTILTARQSVDLGLADKILGEEDENV
jgi:ATP-dependent protease ClpP protease subunit